MEYMTPCTRLRPQISFLCPPFSRARQLILPTLWQTCFQSCFNNTTFPLFPKVMLSYNVDRFFIITATEQDCFFLQSKVYFFTKQECQFVGLCSSCSLACRQIMKNGNWYSKSYIICMQSNCKISEKISRYKIYASYSKWKNVQS
jgi:hypothetical protein